MLEFEMLLKKLQKRQGELCPFGSKMTEMVQEITFDIPGEENQLLSEFRALRSHLSQCDWCAEAMGIQAPPEQLPPLGGDALEALDHLAADLL